MIRARLVPGLWALARHGGIELSLLAASYSAFLQARLGVAGCSTGGCDVVASSPIAHLGDVPLSLVGACAAAAVLVVRLGLGDRSCLASIVSRACLSAMSVVGLALQGYAVGGLHAFCPACLRFAVLVWLACALAWIEPTAQGDGLAQARWASFLIGAGVVAGHIAWAPSLAPPSRFQPTAAARRALAVWRADVSIPVESTLLVFADPFCAHCREEVPLLLARRPRQGWSVRVIWVPADRLAAQVCRIAVAGQGRVDAATWGRAVFSTDTAKPDWQELGRRLRLGSVEASLARRDGSAAAARVAGDGSLARAWGVRSTPAFLATSADGQAREWARDRAYAEALGG